MGKVLLYNRLERGLVVNFIIKVGKFYKDELLMITFQLLFNMTEVFFLTLNKNSFIIFSFISKVYEILLDRESLILLKNDNLFSSIFLVYL